MTTIERIRTYLDDPSLDAKYDNDFLVRQIIEPEMVNVITAINQGRDEPIICKFSLDGLENNFTHAELPPNVGIIHRICAVNAAGNVTDDIAKRDETDPRGPGWSVDGRDLYFRPDWTPDTAGYEVWYTPSGDFTPHYSADGGALLSGALTFTLDTAPDSGDYDRREGAYIGGVLRVWNAAKTMIQERVISGYDVSTRTITVRSAFGTADIPVAGTLRYEIVPEFMGQIWQAVALASCMNLGVARNINEKHMAYLKEQFGLALQTAMSLTSNKIGGKSVAPENSVLYTMLQRIRWGLPEQVEKEMSNDYIMRSVICPKLSEVMTMMNARSDSQTVIRHALTFENNKEYYVLPSCIYKALRLCKTAAGSVIPTEEVRQRDENDPNGNGWSIEGNRLSIRPNPTTGKLTNYLLWYVPSGDFMPHYAKDGTIGNAGKTEIDLTSGGLFSRQLGTVDKRVNAYEGATIRVFETNGTISERTITSHDAVNGIVTVSEAFTSANAATVAYEIVAPWMSTIMSAVVTRSILELMTLKGKLPETDMAVLSESAKSAITSAMMTVREKNAQTMVPNKDSCLHMILEKTKTIIGDIAKELDYSDDYIFRHGIVPEYSRVISRIQNSSSEYIIEKTTISLVKDQQYYLLPACIGEIQRIVTMYDDGRIKTELLPRNQYSTRGPNWYVEGEMLAIRPYPQVAEDIEIWYIPTTDAKPHYAEDGSMNAAGSILTLTAGGWASQILGDLDRRESAYQGCVVRAIGRTAGRVQERIINSHTANSNPPQIDFRAAFTESEITNGVVSYEIVPAHFGAVTEAIAQGAAMNLLVGARRVTKAQHSMLMVNFKSAMKTAMDHFTFKQNRSPKKYERDTVDNRNRYGIR
tara:strand:- start:115 stop:2721 length:2607 start_codon:yes stop_codon:yes gene_type:complete